MAEATRQLTLTTRIASDLTGQVISSVDESWHMMRCTLRWE